MRLGPYSPSEIEAVKTYLEGQNIPFTMDVEKRPMQAWSPEVVHTWFEVDDHDSAKVAKLQKPLLK